MTKEKLFTECLKVRRALEKAAKHNLLPDHMFCCFPRGACLTSTIVLAQYLLRFDDKNAFVIARGWNQNTSHAWLEYNGYTIDITADQFSEIDEPVYITADKKFYSQFQYERKTAKFSEYMLSYDERALFHFVCESIDKKTQNA